jgi:hypothetical protein
MSPARSVNNQAPTMRTALDENGVGARWGYGHVRLLAKIDRHEVRRVVGGFDRSSKMSRFKFVTLNVQRPRATDGCAT